MRLKNRYLCLLFLLLANLGAFAQLNPVFELNEVTVLPLNPTPTDSIFITLSGNKLNKCAVLDTLNHSVELLNVLLLMDWVVDEDAFPGIHCIDTIIPYDTTLNIGLLPPAIYNITLLTDLVTNQADPADFVFEVAPLTCSDQNGVIWVTNRADIGPNTLREAIICANETSGPNTINIYITNDPTPTISIGAMSSTPLPVITDPGTTIDGTIQPGWGGNGNNEPIVKLNGGAGNFGDPTPGLDIRASGTAVFGLEIVDFSGDGILVQNASDVIIGGASSGNIITGNALAGIRMGNNSFGCQINGNWIGTDDEIVLGLGNEEAGIVADNGGVNTSVGLGIFEAENIIVGNPVGAIIDNISGVRFSKNRFECNQEAGIQLVNNGNGNASAPEIVTATPSEIFGTVPFPGAAVEIFMNAADACPTAACQGSVYLGTAFSTIVGFTLSAPFANGVVLQGGERITATQALGSNQSPFSTCKVVAGVSTCTDTQGNIFVTNTQDEGAGSLREAINCANTTLGSNTIVFDIPGNGPHTIEVGFNNGDPLPTIISNGTIIDGSGIILDGGNSTWPVPADGITISADLCEIYNLTIIGFADDGISLINANSNKIGGPGSGNIIYGNGVARDFWSGVPGGPYNGSGIHLNNSTRNEIYNNFIGTDQALLVEDGNEFCGILLEGNCDANIIGQETLNRGNVIYNNEIGIELSANSDRNKLSANQLKCNSVEGINLAFGANEGILAPTIDIARTDTISGFSNEQNGTVELFLLDNIGCTTAPCQGKTLLASQTIANGEWLFTPPYNNNYIPQLGDIIVLTFTDEDDNTSAYSNCANLEVPCFVGLEILELVNTTCGLNNGSVEVMASNGTPNYLYNIGNGNTPNNLFNELSAGFYFVTATDFFGCTAELQVQIESSNSPDVLLVGMGSSTCEASDGMLEFAGTSGVSPYMFSLDGGAAQSSGLFSNLSAGVYGVEIEDAIGCTSTSTAEVTNNGIIPIANYTFATTYDTVQFTDASTEATSIFYNFGDGTASTDANPIHVYDAPGSFEACQIVTNSCGSDTICQQISVVPSPTLFTLEGSVFREDLAAINNVDLICVNSDVTDNSGDYLITDIPIGSNCELSPDKMDEARLGVSISDIVLVQRHLVFLDTLDSPYKIIAADVDGSNSVNITDLISMQRVILFIDTEFSIGKTWRFIPESFTFSNPLNPFAFSFPEEIAVNGIAQNELDQNFIGLKVGDVNNSANPINVQSDSPLSLIGETNIENNILTLDIRAAANINLNGFQGKIGFDPTLIKPLNSQSESSGLIDHYHDRSINFLWWEKEQVKSGAKFSSDKKFYSIQFELLTSNISEAEGSIRLLGNSNIAVDENSVEKNIVLELKHTGFTAQSDGTTFYPNPFDGKLFLKTEHAFESITWRLMDANGKIIALGSKEAQNSALLYDNPDLPAGLYFIELLNNGKRDVERLIKF